ncbi:TPA: amino acid adenylation domain-containing protein [Legionella pneumophila]|nr:amino acid adenylation domain-containing protein [Legionella pneumophila]
MKKKLEPYKISVPQLFELQVKKTPKNKALLDKRYEYSYEELNNKANQFAQTLHDGGVVQGDFVAILLEPSADFILCILAIIKLGAVYVPLDTLAPKSRLDTIIEDTQPRLIVTDESLKQNIEASNVNYSLIKQLHIESISKSKDNPGASITPEDALYMIYTSGSTGKPKGVLIPHQAVANLAVVVNYASVQEGEVIAQFNNLAFDASTFEIWSALLNGCTLSVIPKEDRTQPHELKKTLEEYGVNHLLLPTALFHQLIKSSPHTLNQPQTILYGGEQINPELLRQFIKHRRYLQKPVRLINGYGPTEGTTFACRHIVNEQMIDDEEHLSAIGLPFDNTKIYVLDEHLNEVGEGELYISGIHLALGYHRSDELNAKQFIPNPFDTKAPFEKMYKTGDLVKKLPSGELVYTGRVDDQVKVGGYRIHLSEIERQLMKHEEISLAAVIVELGGGYHKMLTAYLVFKDKPIHASELRIFLNHQLPPYMIPAKWVMVDALPLTPIGKIDKRGLGELPHTDLEFHVDKSATNSTEETIKSIWQHLLNRTHVEVNKNLFDLGATSLLVTDACTQINNALHTQLHVAELMEHPTIHKLSKYIDGDMDIPLVREIHATTSCDIAIVGMSCRFPKANTLEEFWDNLCHGEDCLSRFEPQEMEPSLGATVPLVPVRGVVADIDQFDAAFFNFNPADAKSTDPQHRVFLECVWEALEHAAIAPEKSLNTTISVFSGMTDSSYLHENLLKNQKFCRENDVFHQRIATSMSMLSTQTSYRLNLKGRSVNVNTACSTGLIAVDHACQDLILGQSDVALAGASSIVVPQNSGYTYQPGSIVSPEGYCRPFSINANGTVFSNGVGVVVLKRLDDALRDNNTIYAVIQSRGVNNDGVDKLGFTAPSISGQMSCIKDALHQAQLTADKMDYVEAHGSATALGDVIEVHALSTVYREETERTQYCAIGSVKANIGHTDAAAGIAGLIKTALCLYHQKIPPLAHFTQPNPDLELDESPFFVTTQVQDWPKKSEARYAGVSSFGVGGTNVHMILRDYEPTPCCDELTNPTEELILLSGKTQEALHDQVERFANYLYTTSERLSDIAHTLHVGREDFTWRTFVVGKDHDEVQQNLDHYHVFLHDDEVQHSVVFVLGGQGSSYAKMAMGLFETVPAFQKYMTYGATLAQRYLHCDVLDVIWASDETLLTQTQLAQPALFIIEYALARLLMDCGVKPDALIGHSLGEYVAACLAGVFSFEEGIALVCERGLLMAQAPAGHMFALTCSQEELKSYLSFPGIELALYNSHNQYVVAGSVDRMRVLEQHLITEHKRYHKLQVNHAFHSELMAFVERPFKDILANITLSAPTIPIVSNVTGDWLSTQDALSPDYWYRHMRHTVCFAQGIELLLKDEHPLFVEVGLGHSLSALIRPLAKNKEIMTHTLPGRAHLGTDKEHLLRALGFLWGKGVPIHLEALSEHQNKHRVALPTYPFQKQRYWIAPDSNVRLSTGQPQCYSPVWVRQPLSEFELNLIKDHQWIVFKDEKGIGEHLIQRLEECNAEIYVIEAAADFAIVSPHHFLINPDVKEHYTACFNALKSTLTHPKLIHCWSLDGDADTEDKELDASLERGFFSVMYALQALLSIMKDSQRVDCSIITSDTQSVLGHETMHPATASLVGFCRVAHLEHPSLTCRLADISEDILLSTRADIVGDILGMTLGQAQETLVAYRDTFRWVPSYVLQSRSYHATPLRNQGIYLITGGLGGIGLSLAHAIASEVERPTLILSSRTQYPEENQWETLLQDTHYEYRHVLEALQHLKELGARVRVVCCDVTNKHDVLELIQKSVSQYGALHGIIHAAGVPGVGLIQLKNKDKALDVLAPKLFGTHYLAQATQKIPKLDFVLLMSSLAAHVGLKGQVDYSGANACLDAFASSNLFHAKRTLSINWNAWRTVGMSVSSGTSKVVDLLDVGNDISSEEGKRLFLNALTGYDHHIVISNYDLKAYEDALLHAELEHNTPEQKASRAHLNIKNKYDAPQSDLEKQLAILWQDSLHIDAIGRDDDFFALGGHSLNALTLIEKINKRFGCSLSIQHLYKAPVLGQLARLIEHPEDSIDILVPLTKAVPSGLNLFFCHPVSGMVYCFNELASQWSSDSIYGMQDPSISHGTLLYDSLNSMAKSYAKAIQKLQPNGPYYLVGYSFGGTVLYEVAHLLREAGQDIGLLALIESWSVFSETQHQSGYAIEQVMPVGGKSTKELTRLAAERMKLLLNHRPTHTHQEMVLFKAKKLNEGYQSIDDPYNGWSKFNKGTIICKLMDADHDSILNAQNSRMIAEYLQTMKSVLRKEKDMDT